jgi:hypothetical protein
MDVEEELVFKCLKLDLGIRSVDREISDPGFHRFWNAFTTFGVQFVHPAKQGWMVGALLGRSPDYTPRNIYLPEKVFVHPKTRHCRSRFGVS